ncbi:alpha/beta fold hydrolase [Erythrobacter arachoides]|uniref:Alpha/beta fold hydrolase n=1 Tax=Aurantiacibacter arachoides TaxID=1850444 RepID=A0A845A2M5_9SPHN|nr:alpha/beta fold hydrolase [Aurantiacibacter arachoides]MXO94188.1 alpha/beta fold hydrolase [Aurantiacibacter arachoides]GGD65421.1 hydrolase [Aurantiacibacter arachoides]
MLTFLPGLACDSRMYAPQVAAFPHALVIDGYGMADSLVKMARAVLAAADENGAARLDLFGHSMGGRVAMEVVRMAPDRVRRLALVSTGVHPVGEGEPAKRAALQQIGYDHGFAALVDQWLPPMVAEANRDTPAYAEMRAMSLGKGQALFDAHIKALLGRPPIAGMLPDLACPVLVMTGENDDWAPPEQHRAIADAVPDAELVIVPGAGHMVMREAPEAVNAAIASWLARPAD